MSNPSRLSGSYGFYAPSQCAGTVVTNGNDSSRPVDSYQLGRGNPYQLGLKEEPRMIVMAADTGNFSNSDFSDHNRYPGCAMVEIHKQGYPRNTMSQSEASSRMTSYYTWDPLLGSQEGMLPQPYMFSHSPEIESKVFCAIEYIKYCIFHIFYSNIEYKILNILNINIWYMCIDMTAK